MRGILIAGILGACLFVGGVLGFLLSRPATPVQKFAWVTRSHWEAPAFEWVVTHKEPFPEEDPFADIPDIKTPPKSKTPAKACGCTSACICGCQQGYPCQCLQRYGPGHELRFYYPPPMMQAPMMQHWEAACAGGS